MTNVETCLWFDGNGHEAAQFAVSLIPGSKLTVEVPGGPGGVPLMVGYSLAGVPDVNLNGGPNFRLSEAASIMVWCEDQAETDRLWEAITQDGGAESMCGWCRDRFGVSWQVIPKALPGLIGGPDRDGAARATEAMLQMKKIDIAALEAAYKG